MATVPSSKRRAPPALSSGDSLPRMLSHLGQEVLGGFLLLLGLVLVSTLLLMPIGIPLALLGIALIVTASSP